MGYTSGSAEFTIVPVHDAVFGFHEPAEPDRTKVHVPEALVNRFEADVLLHEQVADADPERSLTGDWSRGRTSPDKVDTST